MKSDLQKWLEDQNYKPVGVSPSNYVGNYIGIILENEVQLSNFYVTLGQWESLYNISRYLTCRDNGTFVISWRIPFVNNIKKSQLQKQLEYLYKLNLNISKPYGTSERNALAIKVVGADALYIVSRHVMEFSLPMIETNAAAYFLSWPDVEFVE
jgi:hypothetical protein